jgi:hypothetical protein
MMRSTALLCVGLLFVVSSHADAVAKSVSDARRRARKDPSPTAKPWDRQDAGRCSRSPWRERSQETWVKQLANAKADLVVVPFEEASSTFDASTLALLSERAAQSTQAR